MLSMTFLVILAAIVLAIVAFLWYLGAFKEVRFHESELPEYDFYYKSYRGAYHNVSQRFTEVCIVGIHLNHPVGWL